MPRNLAVDPAEFDLRLGRDAQRREVTSFVCPATVRAAAPPLSVKPSVETLT